MSNCPSTLFPRPRHMTLRDGCYTLSGMLALDIPPEWRGAVTPELTALAQRLSSLPRGTTRLTVRLGKTMVSAESYHLSITPKGVALEVSCIDGIRYGLRTLMKLMHDGTVPCCEITDWPTLRYRGVQIDLGRVIERPDTVERLLPIYADLGYNVLQLYVENAFVFPSHPKLARPYAWTLEQTMQVVETAGRYGISVIPAIQVMGHCAWVGSHSEYAELDEMRESGTPHGVLCPTQPRTAEVLRAMIHDVAPLATAGIIHLGMDESPYIGRCSLCAPIREEIGEGGLFVRHANAVAAMTKEAGKRPGIWGDMFYYYPEEVPRLDKDVLIFDWYYYTFETAPRVELYDHEPMDTAKMYRANGIESWGCPASFYTTMMPWCLPDESVTNARDWTRYCLENGSDGIMVTQWELSPATIDQCLPVEAAMAGFLWGDDLNTPTSDLLRDACAFLYDKPELAPLLEEMGRMRFHGHGTRRWYNAQTLPQMITYLDPAPDLALAARMEEVGAEIARIARDAKRAEMALAFVPAARWLVYQYRKRALVNQAALAACAGRYSEAGAIMQQLRDAALKLADQYQAEWNRNRYAGDTAALPTRLHHEAALFDEEMAALAQAAAGDAYAGHLTTPILVVRVVDKFGTMARIDAAVSADGETFTDLGVAWVLQFDSRAAGKYEAQEIPYTFPVSNLDAARYVKITASGPGHYAIQSITLHQGTTTRTVNAVSARGMVEDAGALLTGGLAILGHPDPKALFHELLAAGDSSQVFTVVHGSVTTEMGG